MPVYSFGDVILVPFPFTDQTGTKKRPAVIVSNAAYNQERRDVMMNLPWFHVHQIVGKLLMNGGRNEQERVDWESAVHG